MTQKQHQKITHYRNQFIENKKRYAANGSESICKFAVFENMNPDDKNITLVIVSVGGISEDYQPYTAINNLLIEPDGNAIKLTDIYPKEEVLVYIEKLKRIE